MGVSTHSIEVNAPLKAVYNQKKEDGGQVVGEVRSVKEKIPIWGFCRRRAHA
jgi:hypothetical protein